jgi:hypothetical protein
MKPIRSGEVKSMVAEQDSSYADWFLIGILTEIPDVDGGLISVFLDGAPKQGSIFNPTSTQAYGLGQIDIGKCDALLRCNSSLSFDVGDRVSVFSKNDAFGNENFYVSAYPVYFRTCMVVPLSKIFPNKGNLEMIGKAIVAIFSPSLDFSDARNSMYVPIR